MRRTVPSTEQPSNTSDNVGGIRVVDSARKACPSLRKLWCDGGFKNAFAAAEAWVHHKALALLDGKAWIVAAAIRRKATCLRLVKADRVNADRAAGYLPDPMESPPARFQHLLSH